MSGADQRGSFLGAISPWSTPRSATPQPSTQDHLEYKGALQRSQGNDHTVTARNWVSLSQYPKDCPPLRARWFYAVDSPKRKPLTSDVKTNTAKQLPLPKKFVPFSVKDSQSIEAAFHKLPNLESAKEGHQESSSARKGKEDAIKVPVNEDYLFDVNVDEREISPAYWIGPVYEVRRGTWFFQDGSTLKPCEENLATQLEQGYLKVKPWQSRHAANPTPTPSSTKIDENGKASHSHETSSSDGHQSGGVVGAKPEPTQSTLPSAKEPPHLRLFGAYMNSTVTYTDSSTALLNQDDFMSRVGSTLYLKFGGVAGTRVIRGYNELNKVNGPIDTPTVDNKSANREVPQRDRTPIKPDTSTLVSRQSDGPETTQASAFQPRNSGNKNVVSDIRSPLERQMSSLAGEPQDTTEIEEQARQQEEKEMEDSKDVDEDDREREVDHLILVTHGIGQRLGLRLESINFIHDVNVLRKTLKSVYKASPDLQALNSGFADNDRNCRVQVLPVCWRHLLDFPNREYKQNRKEHDLADVDDLEDDLYPSLSDITLEGVSSVRNLVSDLAMDVLLYQSAYCEHIESIVQQECNRIYELFKKRNPSFQGSISLCGHSLGSAILFDILCDQQDDPGAAQLSSGHHQSNKPLRQGLREKNGFPLDFDCEEFFCLGSPIALFQMLKGKRIAGRSSVSTDPARRPNAAGIESQESSTSGHRSVKSRPSDALEVISPTVSSPKCRQLYNIFHPSDPVSYRIEPLISPAMAALKPQPLPCIKKSLWAVPGQSLSIIGTRVGQSVGTLWTNFASGVASNLLNRSLGLNSEDLPPQPTPGTGGNLHQADSLRVSNANAGQSRTLIEQQLVTLYGGSEKTHEKGKETGPQSSRPENAAESLDVDDRSRRLKIEDSKVRALNSNARVDYSIQEGTFDISLIASIASHLSYWADEDVNHFMLSQLLSGKSK
ncbi:hypothetical protein ASPZODRAFT_126310 [Penicilliopsis zonata CBS 506.65]|uniref:DDHD domain-containing protein n=1 Tax=Penicilliopsis zonata CBS 506.65 TaxID=1073090 RepID=A0A1L9STN8_9EURO|nr:hypothetical protein ASPZODRAFT_126310 [Penicilliopsis zonata CBS 506.65]OJJ50443.1 hypothetical protein ASPZODRAFT_126310 [Penicilliopsis zonata CBS 506.65]